jgi:hypothetical protein
MKIEYCLRLPRQRFRTTEIMAQERSLPTRPPRITCLLALAHRLEELVRSGDSADYAQLAKLGHISRARMSQILKLLTLAPSIQEYILFLPPRAAGDDTITERELRKVVREPTWDRQRVLFDQLLRHRRMRNAEPPPGR